MVKKYIGFFLAICLFANSESKSTKEVVLDLVAEFKARMCSPQDDLGLPQLHPLTIAKLPFNISMELAHLRGYLRDFVVQGLGDFTLMDKEVIVNLLQGITAAVRIPKIKINGYLKAEGDIGEIPIEGPGGNIQITIEDLYTKIQVKPVSGGKYALINITQLTVTMSTFNAALSGLTEYQDVDRFLSSVATQLTARILKEYLEDGKTAATIKKTLSDLLNDKLPKHSMMELMYILLGQTNPFKPFPEDKKCKKKPEPEVHLITRT